MVDSVISAGFQGVQNGLNTARKAAEDIATATTTPVSSTSDQNITADITQAAVELKVSELQVQASAEVIKTGDEIIGSLLDINA